MTKKKTKVVKKGTKNTAAKKKTPPKPPAPKPPEPPVEEDKPKPEPKIVAVSRQAKVDVGGREIEVTVKMFAISEDAKAKLELEDAPEFSTRKEAQAFLVDRRNEIRSATTPKKVETMINRFARMSAQLSKSSQGLEDFEGVAGELEQAIDCLDRAIAHLSKKEEEEA